MMKIMFGFFALAVLGAWRSAGSALPARLLSHPASGSIAAALPAAKDKNSRRLKSIIFFSFLVLR